MSESHLPDDLRQWPDDPYAVLGIGPGTGFRQFRKAYASLIRIYKPEQYPAEFRRIRDAYESLKDWIRWQEEESGGPPAHTDDSFGETGGFQFTAASHEAFDSEAGRSFESELDALWDMARLGDLAEAYRKLAEVDRRSPGQEEVCLRGYWMLTLWPSLDPGRQSAEWLVAGLRRNGLGGRLLELYGAELENNPQEAAGDRAAGLLESAAPAARLVELAALRWKGVPIPQRFSLIAADLRRLEHRTEEDEGAWASLLFAALDHLAWDTADPSRSLAAECWRKLESWAAQNQKLAGSLARCDLLLELVRGRNAMLASLGASREFFEPLYHLIPELWMRPVEAVRRPLLNLLKPLVEAPWSGLERLDRLGAQAGAVLHHLGRAIVALYQRSPASWTHSNTDRLLDEVNGFLSAMAARLDPADYEALRPIILRVCTREGMTVQQFGELLYRSNRPPSQYAGLAERLAADAPLHYLCQGCLVFWG